MNKLYITLTFLVFSLVLRAERDSVITLDTNDVFYSLSDDSETFVDRTNWHVAFNVQNRSASILINEGNGVELYLASSDMNDWASFDTTGMSWDNIYNSSEDWETGAFNNVGSGVHPDYGWGTYNNFTKDVNASRFFVMKLADGSFKKIKINSMIANGTFDFTYANLDGSSESTQTISKSDYAAVNYVYFDVLSGSVIDEEPLAADWDILFTKYVAAIQAGPTTAYYPVSGIKVNLGLEIAQREGVPAASDDTSGLNWGTTITEIGYDWKSFNRTTFQYDIQDSLAFFVKNSSGEIWKLIFTDYEGGSQSKYVFERTKISEGNPTALDAVSKKEVKLYPNPAKGMLNLSQDVKNFSLMNIAGQQVFNQALVNARLDLSHLQAGSYIASYESEGQLFRTRLILE